MFRRRCSWFVKYTAIFVAPLAAILTGISPGDAFTKLSGEAFSIGVGARALGMGSAFVSVVGGTSSLYWNPSGMSWEGERELLAMHSERFGGELNYDFIGYSQPIGTEENRSVIGFGMIRLGVSGIQETAVDNPDDDPGPDNRPFVVGSLGTAQYQFLIGYATELKNRYRIGGNVKIVHKDLDVAKGTGFGFDIGAIIPIGKERPLSLGIVLQDVPTTFVAFDTGEKETTAPTLRTGLSLNDPIEIPGGGIILAAAASVRFTERGSTTDQVGLNRVSMNFHLGGEYTIRKQVSLRGGLDEGTPTAGGGILVKNFAADYAWFASPGEGLDNTHRVSIGFYF